MVMGLEERERVQKVRAFMSGNNIVRTSLTALWTSIQFALSEECSKPDAGSEVGSISKQKESQHNNIDTCVSKQLIMYIMIMVYVCIKCT